VKHAKSAVVVAVVAGSVVAFGAAAPAFAVNRGGPQTNLSRGVSEALSNPQLKGDEIHPLVEQVSGVANAVKEEKENLLGGAKGVTKKVAKKVTKKVNKKVPLLGGKPAGKP
jgi:hypothetical protein